MARHPPEIEARRRKLTHVVIVAAVKTLAAILAHAHLPYDRKGQVTSPKSLQCLNAYNTNTLYLS